MQNTEILMMELISLDVVTTFILPVSYRKIKQNMFNCQCFVKQCTGLTSITYKAMH